MKVIFFLSVLFISFSSHAYYYLNYKMETISPGKPELYRVFLSVITGDEINCIKDYDPPYYYRCSATFKVIIPLSRNTYEISVGSGGGRGDVTVSLYEICKTRNMALLENETVYKKKLGFKVLQFESLDFTDFGCPHGEKIIHD